MTADRLHDDEVDIDGDLVRALVDAQFPDYRGLALQRAPSTGTVNAIYRLGDDLYVRLPRRQQFVGDLETELDWLPRLAPHLSLRLPEPVTRGEPTRAYPHTWAVYRWLPGTPATHAQLHEVDALARFVSELRCIDTRGAPKSTRDFPLRLLDPGARVALEKLQGVVDTDAARVAWETSLAGPEWDGTPVWTHGDLLPPNLLAHGDRLSAVLDFGCVGVGDPAVDVIPAWSVFDERGRDAYRRALDVDDETWIRARGYALHQALLIIPYYRDTNPAFADLATRTVGEVLADVRR